MTFREILFLLSIPVLVAGFFLYATPSRENSLRNPENSSRKTVDWKNIKDDPALHYNYKTMLFLHNFGQPGTWKRKWLEDKFNASFDIIRVDPSVYAQKMPLILASGEIPDFFDCLMSQKKLARNGYLMELPYELLARHAPNMVRLINRYAPNAWSLTYDEKTGGNCGIPLLWPEGRYPKTGIWRADWLANIGYDHAPETLEEFHDALYKFTYNDPDGNGVNDTYGMSGDIKFYPSTFTEIFGAFGIQPYNWILRDGEITWGGIQPEAKQALEFLRKCYEEKIIHPDMLTDNVFTEGQQKFYEGKIGYVNYSCWYEKFSADNPQSTVSIFKTINPKAKIIPGPPPVGPAGKRSSRIASLVHGTTLVFGSHMVDSPEKVIRILRMFDAIYSDEDTYVKFFIGKQGLHWDFKKDSPEKKIVALPPYDNKFVMENEGALTPENLIQFGDSEIIAKYMNGTEADFDMKYRNPEWAGCDIFMGGTVNQSEKYMGALRLLQLQNYAEIISGRRPLSDFEGFVAKWRNQGGDILVG
ncbi:MAG: extracellular solute-binding protein, partial [Lentisphaerota bacterium]